MPAKAARICPRCKGSVPGGQPCPRCRPEQRQEADARRPNATQRGYDGAWQKARAAYLAKHPRCCRCGAPATVVDHKTPHRGDRALFWSRENWQPLCAPCHNGPKQAAEKAGGQAEFGIGADRPAQ